MDKRTKRLSEFEEWIRIFSAFHQQKGTKLNFIPNAAEILNEMYWRYVEHYVKPLITKVDNAKNDILEARISRFKIISATELCIVDVQPILSDDDSIRNINAQFAYFVALQILLVFSETTISDETIDFVSRYKETTPGVDPSDIMSVMDEHIAWLSLLDAGVSLPIFSNSQTWRLFYLTLLTVEGKTAKKTLS